MAKSIYLSPSTQEHNAFAYGGVVEEENSNAVADILEVALSKKYGFIVYRNRPDMNLKQMIDDSNAKKPDIHVAIHSNAGGGRGCEVYYYKIAGKVCPSQRLSQYIYNEFESITPSKDRGIKDGRALNLGEIVRTNACATLIEMAFHDNVDDAKWLIENRQACSTAIEKGICNYFGVAYIPDKAPEPVPAPAEEGVLYRVQVGAFSVRDNATRMLSKLKNNGFNGFIANGTLDGKPLFRVQVGAFSVKANADRMLSNLESKGFKGFIFKVIK